MAASPRRRRVILWSLLVGFLVGLGVVLNARLSPEPRCVIPVTYPAPLPDMPWDPVNVNFLTDDGAIILTWNCAPRRGPYLLQFDGWDTQSGQKLGTFQSDPFANNWNNDQWRDAKITRDNVETTEDGKFSSVRELTNRQPGFLQQLLGDWWPTNINPNEMKVTVVETATERILGQLQGSYGNGHVSNDGRTLITAYREPDGKLSLRCWDLPLRPPLRLVVGIPLGIGLLFVLVSWWRGRRRAKSLPA